MSKMNSNLEALAIERYREMKEAPRKERERERVGASQGEIVG